MGMNDSSQTDVDNFIAWYHKEETAYQTGQTNLLPPTLSAAGDTSINQHFSTQVAGYRFLQGANGVNCMIKNAGLGPCPTSPATSLP